MVSLRDYLNKMISLQSTWLASACDLCFGNALKTILEKTHSPVRVIPGRLYREVISLQQIQSF